MKVDNWIRALNEIFHQRWTEEDRVNRLSDLIEWSSFEILNFMVEIYELYSIELSTKDVYGIETLDQLIQLLEEKAACDDVERK